MNNITKLKLNSITSLVNQIVTVIFGLIVPRFILLYYGSDINGLVSSINQFLNIITFLELGVGAVVLSALYYPIAKNDYNHINTILASAKQFFNNLSKIIVVYVILLMITYPIIIESPMSHFDTAFLIFAMSISLFAQYYFGIVNQLYLNANQKNYISILANIILTIFKTVASVILIVNGASIQAVKLLASLIFILKPIFLKYYINKNYNIDYNAKPKNDAIPQKWNGVAQHIAYIISQSTDIVVLTLFSSLSNVSIYSVYNMVVNGIKTLLTSVTNGIDAFFGNLIAIGEIKKANTYFKDIEWIIHISTVFLFGMTGILLNSFVLIYTKGITDTNYNQPVFALLITIANAMFCLRIPYNSVVLAAGHFKRTQNSSIIEALINIIISTLTVKRFDLIGVSIGTLIAMSYKTLYLVDYISKNILYRPKRIFIKYLIVDILNFSLILIISNLISFNPVNYFEWFIYALVIGIIYIVIMIIINFIFYREILLKFCKKVFRIRNRALK